MLWAGLILSILGSAAKNKQLKEGQRRQMTEMRKGREKQKLTEEEQRAAVTKESEAYDPNVRQEALDTKATETEEKIKAVLQDNEAITTGDTGVLSEPLLAQRAKSTRDRANNASILAALLSKVQAPGYTSQDESLDMKRLVGESQQRTGDIGRAGTTAEILANLQGRPSPEAMAMSGILQSLGGGMASAGIMGGVQKPGGTTPTGGYSPNPDYVTDWSKVDWMGGV